MSRAIAIAYTEQLSRSLRTQGCITFDFDDLRQLRSVEFITFFDPRNHGPIWIVKNKEFTFSAVGDSCIVTAHIECLIDLYEVDGQLRLEVFQELSDKLRGGNVFHEVDGEKLLQAAEPIRFRSPSTSSFLSLKEATQRLAWTYGVEEEKVSIRIQN